MTTTEYVDDLIFRLEGKGVVDPNASEPTLRERLKIDDTGEALQKILTTIPLTDLGRIHALMYAGSEGASPVELKRLFANRSRSDMERALIEKRSSLSTYLRKGLEKIEADGIELNSM